MCLGCMLECNFRHSAGTQRSHIDWLYLLNWSLEYDRTTISIVPATHITGPISSGMVYLLVRDLVFSCLCSVWPWLFSQAMPKELKEHVPLCFLYYLKRIPTRCNTWHFKSALLNFSVGFTDLTRLDLTSRCNFWYCRSRCASVSGEANSWILDHYLSNGVSRWLQLWGEIFHSYPFIICGADYFIFDSSILAKLWILLSLIGWNMEVLMTLDDWSSRLIDLSCIRRGRSQLSKACSTISAELRAVLIHCKTSYAWASWVGASNVSLIVDLLDWTFPPPADWPNRSVECWERNSFVVRVWWLKVRMNCFSVLILTGSQLS